MTQLVIKITVVTSNQGSEDREYGTNFRHIVIDSWTNTYLKMSELIAEGYTLQTVLQSSSAVHHFLVKDIEVVEKAPELDI